MNLHPLRADLAVMNILCEHRLAAGESLAQEILAASWRRYGLREHDLARAVGRLQSLGMIASRQKGGSRQVALTQAGREWLYSVQGISARLLLIPRLLGSLLAGWRLPSEGRSMRRRRDDGPRLET